MPQRQSKQTHGKEGFFGLCLAYYMAVAQRQSPVDRYYHLDLNAGSGHNYGRNVVGTPMVFLRQVQKRWADRPLLSWFVDRRQIACKELRTLIGSHVNGHLFRDTDQQFHVYRDDANERLARFAEIPPINAWGSIVSDPNGVGLPAGALDLYVAERALQQLPQFLLMVFFPAAGARRCRAYAMGAGAGGATPREKCPVRYLRDFLPLRRYWLFQENGNHVYLAGAPFLMKEKPEQGVYAMDSSRGDQLLRTWDTDAWAS